MAPDDQTSPENGESTTPARRRRVTRGFPASTFEDALPLADAIQRFAAGQRVRRLTLFEKLGKSPDSGPSRQLVTNANKYGLTKGSYSSEHLELTPDGAAAVELDASPRKRLQARFHLAIEHVQPFKDLYDAFKEKRLPDQAVLKDYLRDHHEYSDTASTECVDTFVLNTKFLGLLRTIGGAERLLPIEHLLDEHPSAPPLGMSGIPGPSPDAEDIELHRDETIDWDRVCFYVTPIGEDDSEERQHSDLFLGALVEPALSDFGLEVVRADQIGRPGMISAQVIEHLVKARLVVADLSFNNPNVFYELALRHASRRPIVQIIRSCDPIPFDLDQFRTIQIDTGSIYALVPKLEIHRSAIANQARRAMESDNEIENPLTVFYPAFFEPLRVSPS